MFVLHKMYFNTVVSLEGGTGRLHSRDPKQLIKEPSLALGLSFKTNKGVVHSGVRSGELLLSETMSCTSPRLYSQLSRALWAKTLYLPKC